MVLPARKIKMTPEIRAIVKRAKRWAKSPAGQAEIRHGQQLADQTIADLKKARRITDGPKRFR